MSETTFSHQKANSPDATYSDGGLRSFFVYRDTGINAATKGKVRVQLVRAAYKSSEAKGGTGFHFHTADVHVVYMLRGWAKVAGSWDAIFRNTGYIQFVLTDEQVVVNGDTAWVTLDENILQSAGTSELSGARATATNVSTN